MTSASAVQSYTLANPEAETKLRRATGLVFRCREDIDLDIDSLAGGGGGLRVDSVWIALAVHLDVEVEITVEELQVLGQINETLWSERTELVIKHSSASIQSLLGKGLLIGMENSTGENSAGARDELLRSMHWFAPAATLHYFSRWQDINTEASGVQDRFPSMREMAQEFGMPPKLTVERCDADDRVDLPKPEHNEFDALLHRRLSCRNFDSQRALPLQTLATMLHRVYGAQAVHEISAGCEIMKKNSPTGGGLHPLEAYVLVQNVDGLLAGIYHYHPINHALEPLPQSAEFDLADFAFRAIAGQRYFSTAPVIVFTTMRIFRHHWKYRDHGKAYRVMNLEAGHFSQTLFLSATDLGLGAFVTAAMNEKLIEPVLGIDPLVETPLCINGFGYRAELRGETEFDPLENIWNLHDGALKPTS